MATTTVSGVIHDPSGTGIEGVTVNARLVPFGWTGTVGIAQLETTTTSASGAYSLTLERNSDILPAGTWYEIEEQIPTSAGGPRIFTISVKSSSSSVYGSLVTPSQSTGFSTYLTQAAADARYATSVATGLTGIDVTAAPYSAVGDCQFISDAAMTSASAVLTSASGLFVAGDVGKVVHVAGAGPLSTDGNLFQTGLATTIASYQSSTQVTLSTTASATVSGATASWGTDNVTAFNLAFTAASTLGKVLFAPKGKYALNGQLSPTDLSNIHLFGAGAQTVLVRHGSARNSDNYLTGKIVEFLRGDNLILHDLAVDMNGHEGGGAGLILQDLNHFWIDRIYGYDSARKATESGNDHYFIQIQGCDDGQVSNIQATDLPCVELSGTTVGCRRIKISDCISTGCTSSSAVGIFSQTNGVLGTPILWEDIDIARCTSYDSRKGNFAIRQETGRDYNTFRRINIVDCTAHAATRVPARRHLHLGKTSTSGGAGTGSTWHDITVRNFRSTSEVSSESSERVKLSHVDTTLLFNRVVIDGLEVSDCDYAGAYGVQIKQTKNSELTGMVVTGAVSGIQVADMEYTVIHDNLVSATTNGYQFSGSGSTNGHNDWTHNNRIGSATPTNPIVQSSIHATDNPTPRTWVGPFIQENVAASQTDVALDLGLASARTSLPAVRPGSITGVVVRSAGARSAGTLTVEPTINGTGTGLTAVLNASNTTAKATTQPACLDAFVAGDALGVKITTDGSWAPTTADITVLIEVAEGA